MVRRSPWMCWDGSFCGQFNKQFHLDVSDRFQHRRADGSASLAFREWVAVQRTSHTHQAVLSLAAEPTGQYLYAGYLSGAAAGESAVITYAIDATHLALVPMPQFEVDQPQQSNLSMLVDAHGRNLYVADFMAAEVSIYQINAANGSLDQR